MKTGRTAATPRGLKSYLPFLDWGQRYDRATFASDATAAVIVTIMLIPQALAYALLAGLPPQVGIYASLVPLVCYALLGTSGALAVGPVAVVSLMTASAVGQVAAEGTMGYAAAALSLALMSGLILLFTGIFRMGFVANFLSHPVIAGFVTASGILIAFSQAKYLLGVQASGDTLTEILAGLIRDAGETRPATLIVGGVALIFLLWARRGLAPLLRRIGLPAGLASGLGRTAPVIAVIAATLASHLFGLGARGVALVGDVTASALPPLTMPALSPGLLGTLFVPALVISIIGFVESISIAQTYAARTGRAIDPDQELIALGASNIGAAFTGGYPVTGGFARSVVNFEAGARTPAAGGMTAIGLALAASFLTPLIHDLPKAVLAATIITAVLGLVDFSMLRRTWNYARADFWAVAATLLVTLALGVEAGVATGVAISLGLHLYQTTRPHVAEVGRVPGSEHFRNVERHLVETDPALLTLRIDESLYFVNARFLESAVFGRLARGEEVRHVVLMCSAVNAIDFSALETLEAINDALRARGIGLHLSEVKGPVMDRLKTTHFLSALNGRVFLSQYDAWCHLTGQGGPNGQDERGPG